MRLLSAGEGAAAGAAGGAAGTPRGRLRCASALPLAEFTAVEQVELGADAQHPGPAAHRCTDPQGGGATSQSEQSVAFLFFPIQ